MRRVAQGCVAGFALLTLAVASPALAQDNLDAGKTAAQLYASDCAICHKTPQGLTKGGGIFGLTSFLREHYTSSRESAAAIANYVQSVDNGPAPAAKRPAKRAAKRDDKAAKPEEGKPGEMKAGESKKDDAGSAKAKPEAKPAEAKASAGKSDGSKAGGDAKAEAKPESKPDSKPAAAKDDKPQKSD